MLCAGLYFAKLRDCAALVRRVCYAVFVVHPTKLLRPCQAAPLNIRDEPRKTFASPRQTFAPSPVKLSHPPVKLLCLARQTFVFPHQTFVASQARCATLHYALLHAALGSIRSLHCVCSTHWSSLRHVVLVVLCSLARRVDAVLGALHCGVMHFLAVLRVLCCACLLRRKLSTSPAEVSA
jgi:hypothetical protein